MWQLRWQSTSSYRTTCQIAQNHDTSIPGQSLFHPPLLLHQIGFLIHTFQSPFLCNSAITLLLIPLPAIGCQTFRVKPSTVWALRISLFQLVQLVGNVMNRGRKKILPCQPAVVEMAAPSCIFLLRSCIVLFCPSFGLHPPVGVQ